MAEPHFSCHDLAVGPAGQALLEGLSLQVDGDDALALYGPSGLGKTTLLRSLAGLVDPLAGQVLLEGRTPAEHGWAGYRRQVLLVEQQPVLLEGTVRDNLERPFGYASAGGARFPADEAAELLEQLGLSGDCLDGPTGRLSVGEQQRVCLVRALCVGPRVLLLDEPTSALDAGSAGRTVEVLQRHCREHGTAVVLVSHQTDWAEQWCERMLDLSDYQVADRG